MKPVDDMIHLTVGDMLHDIAVRFPDHLAVKYTDTDYERTYAEFDRETDEYAKGFLAMGFTKGDHIAMWATNYPEWLITLFAAAKIGAVLVTVNTNYRIYELEYLMRQSDSKGLVFCDGLKDIDCHAIITELCPEIETMPLGEPVCKKLPWLKKVISIDKNYPNMYKFSDIKEMGRGIPDERLDEIKRSLDVHDIVNMQYTSGTTGFPKGVMLTHFNIVNNGKGIGDCMNFTENDKLCIPVPFFHCFGLVLAIMASVTHGTGMVPVYFYNPLKVMKAIQSERCTAMHGVPTMYIAILEHPDFAKYDFSSLRTGIMAGSPCPVKVMQDVIDKMHMSEITITYGQTEASPACTMTTVHDSLERRVATVGKSMPHVETKIVDPETGETLPPHVPGEFCARGYNIMRGYYNMPEATAQAIDADGWLHTGDLAMVDEDGYYKITGRIKDMIIRGGENIYPKELEEFIYTHPKVKDVQVIGVPSQKFGEEVMAYVILKEGEQMTEEEVLDFVRANMARHKVPSYVRFIAQFPMTASGKIQKFKLREMAIKELHLEDAAGIETA